MTDDDWYSIDPRAWIDYEDFLYDEIEDTIRVIEWQDEDPQASMRVLFSPTMPEWVVGEICGLFR